MANPCGDSTAALPWCPRRFSLRGFLIAVTAIAAAVATATAAEPPKNIVLILADDLGRGDVGALGGRRIRTPALDAIAAALEPSRQVVYKTVNGRELYLHVFEPDGWAAGDRRSCFLVIHGGGWAGACVDIGADAIVVSNHGGRQLDAAQTSIDALPARSTATASSRPS